MSKSCCALIVAAGKGRRFGPGEPKQLVPLAGRPLLVWTLEAFERCRAIDAIVVVVASEQLERVRRLVREWRLAKVVQVYEGGDERYDSVFSGLAVLPVGAELVAIHDGARPLVTPELIERVVCEAEVHGAAVPAQPARDTVKRGVDRFVMTTESRDELFLAQTPQVFTKDLIRRAYAAWQPAVDTSVTDDAQLVERIGHPVRLVDGDPANIKITVPSDLRLAEALLALGDRSAEPTIRVGTGYDVHRLVPGRRLVLGGVEVDHPAGLLGHSDADVLCHAVGDALLGAAGLGDLGVHFPPTDRYRGADSLDLLSRIGAMVARAGLRLCNLDVTVVCEQPRLGPFRQAIRENLARALGAPTERISVKATTTEGLGFTGREEGIAAQAVVSLAPSGT